MFYSRLGSDVQISWPLSIEGVDDISTLDIKIYVKCERYRKSIPFTTENNTLLFTFYGKDQRVRGNYDLELVINEDKEGQMIYDNKNVFTLIK